jgi:hypothetical protein
MTHAHLPRTYALVRPEPTLDPVPWDLPVSAYQEIGARVVGAFEVAQVAGTSVSMATLARIIEAAVAES